MPLPLLEVDPLAPTTACGATLQQHYCVAVGLNMEQRAFVQWEEAGLTELVT